jgi:hypothetical protein
MFYTKHSNIRKSKGKEKMNTLRKKEAQMKYQRVGLVDLSEFPYEISRSVLYKWARGERYGAAFKRVGGSVWVSLERLLNIIEED